MTRRIALALVLLTAAVLIAAVVPLALGAIDHERDAFVSDTAGTASSIALLARGTLERQGQGQAHGPADRQRRVPGGRQVQRGGCEGHIQQTHGRDDPGGRGHLQRLPQARQPAAGDGGQEGEHRDGTHRPHAPCNSQRQRRQHERQQDIANLVHPTLTRNLLDRQLH